MNKKIIENRLKNSLKRLYYYDSQIIDNNSNERSITHRLAVHLGTVFFEWDVDVEYNRNLNDIKAFNEQAMKVLEAADDKMDFLTGVKTVYPDIIVHIRGTRNNLLAIEVKKMSTSERLEQYDINKIKGYIIEESLNYKYVAFIKLAPSNEIEKNKIIIKSREEVQQEIANGELDFG